MDYAILRIEKLRTIGNIAASAGHNFRTRETPNADPRRTPENITRGAQSPELICAAVQARLDSAAPIRKNAVRAVEFLISASPKWFTDNNSTAREDYFDATDKWLQQRHGSENVITFTRHYDETSPHVCAYVVPISPKGKLNCSYFYDGRIMLTELQTNFAENVGKKFHLERGILGSKANHISIKRYYATIRARTPEIQTQIPVVQDATVFEIVKGTMGYPTDHARQLARQEALKKKRQAEIEAQREAERAKAKLHDALGPEMKSRSEKLAQLIATAIQPLDMKMVSVLERLGCTREPTGKKIWRTPVGLVTINNQAEFDIPSLAKRGHGAIELVMLIEETDFNGAVTRLAQHYKLPEVLAQAAVTLKSEIESAFRAQLPRFSAPEPKPENWPKVRQYLINELLFEAKLVDRLHEIGSIYADSYTNAVFVLGENHKVGVELRGTDEKPYVGVKGEKAPFVIPGGTERVAFVGSTIDAVSFGTLGRFDGSIVSVAGVPAAAVESLVRRVREAGRTVVAAFAKSKTGNEIAASLGEPKERIYPQGKEWNDDLRIANSSPAERTALGEQLQQEQDPERPAPSIGS